MDGLAPLAQEEFAVGTNIWEPFQVQTSFHFSLFPASSFYPPVLVFPATSVHLLICPVSQSPVTRRINIFYKSSVRPI